VTSTILQIIQSVATERAGRSLANLFDLKAGDLIAVYQHAPGIRGRLPLRIGFDPTDAELGEWSDSRLKWRHPAEVFMARLEASEPYDDWKTKAEPLFDSEAAP
jgi:hypothetical protein